MAAAEGLIAVCRAAQLADGGPGVRFEVVVGAEPAAAFVVRHRGRVFGYLNRCAHVATELDWIAGQFFDAEGETLVCATHGAAYDPASGKCVGGPCAGRGGLRPLPVVEDGDVIYWRPAGDVRARRAEAASG
jgi:nitrite reductase/ring-hydroxylating ferredoxin subunit